MRGRRRTGLVAAVAVTALLGLYGGLVVLRSVALLRTGEPVGVVLGLAFLVLPLLVLALLWREWRLALDAQAMADSLSDEGRLPVDDLPRSPGGRIDRAVARERFGAAREHAERAPDDWRSWYLLGFAYDAAGDRRRARESLRHASRLRRGGSVRRGPGA